MKNGHLEQHMSWLLEVAYMKEWSKWKKAAVVCTVYGADYYYNKFIVFNSIELTVGWTQVILTTRCRSYLVINMASVSGRPRKEDILKHSGGSATRIL